MPRTHALRYTSSILMSVFSAVVGGIALALWLTQVDNSAAGGRRREGVYLWAGLAEIFWALRVADSAMSRPPLPWEAWGTLMAACYSGWTGAAVLFCHHLAGWHRHESYRWVRWVILVVFAAPVLVTWLALSQAQPQWLTTYIAIEIAALFLYLVGFLVATWRRPNTARVLVAAVIMVVVAVAARDWYVILLSEAYGALPWLRYTSLIFGFTLLGILVARFRSATAQARDLLATLSARLAQREGELAASYRRLELAAREQARAQERERIFGDMHDGVGCAPELRRSASCRPAAPATDQLLQILRESLDQLKLVDRFGPPSRPPTWVPCWPRCATG